MDSSGFKFLIIRPAFDDLGSTEVLTEPSYSSPAFAWNGATPPTSGPPSCHSAVGALTPVTFSIRLAGLPPRPRCCSFSRLTYAAVAHFHFRDIQFQPAKKSRNSLNIF